MAKHILIIGSPGSGKSVFSAALASAVGKRNRQTLLISERFMQERLHRSVPQMQLKSCVNFRTSV